MSVLKPYDIAPPITAALMQRIDEDFNRLYEALNETANAVGTSGDFEAINADTVILSRGTPVYLDGGTGAVPTVKRAKADALATMPAIGLVDTPGSPDATVVVRPHGTLTQIDTSSFTMSASLYVSGATAGALTATAPSGTNIAQIVATVIAVGSTGVIFIGIEASTHGLLSIIHPDSTATAPTRGDLVTAQNASPTWNALSLGGSGTVPRSDGTDLAYSTFTIDDTFADERIPYATATNMLSSSAQLLFDEAEFKLAPSTPGNWIGIVAFDTDVAGFTYLTLGENTSTKFMTFEYHNASLNSPGGTTLIDNNAAGVLRTGNDASGGLSILTQHASAPLRFGTGGFAASNQRMEIAADGSYVSIISPGAATELRLLEPSGFGTNYTGFRAPTLVGNVIYTLPSADATVAGQVLSSDGSEGTSWADHGSIAGLTDDDHTQYLLAAGSRALTADWDAGSFKITAQDVTIDSMTLGSVLFAGTGGAVTQDNGGLFWDDSNDRLGIGTSSPATTIHYVSDGANLTDDVYSDSVSPGYTARRAKGTEASPSAVTAFIALGGMSGSGFHSGSAFGGIVGAVTILASENFTASAQGSMILLQTTPSGSTTSAIAAVVTQAANFSIGSGVLTDPGTGTKGLIFEDGTAFSNMDSNTAGFYADSVSGTVTMFAIDENDVLTRLTKPFGVLDTQNQETRIQHAITEVTGMSGGTATASSLIPAGCFLLGVTIRVTTEITGATSFTIGDGSDPDRWGTGIALTAGTTTDITDFTADGFGQFTSANDVVLTQAGGDFTAGAVRITAHYLNLIPATS